MRAYFFDIEANGLLDTITRIHSLVFKDRETGEVWSLADKGTDDSEIVRGLRLLMEADLIIGHNIIKYDIPAIQLVYPWFEIDESKVYDTVVVSRLIWTDLATKDHKKIAAGKTTLPAKLTGWHSLEAWGHRLGIWKGDYAKIKEAEGIEQGIEPDTPEMSQFVWGTWSHDMQDYCELDVEVTEAFYKFIQDKDYSEQAIQLENDLQHIIARMERNGFAFNVAKAEELERQLIGLRAELEDQLRTIFSPWYTADGPVRTPKRPNRSIGYWGEGKGADFVGYPYQKVKRVVFNPGSNDQIANRFIKLYGWKPREMTPKGKPKIDDTILEGLPYPEAAELARFKMVQKRLGQLAEGDKAWLRYVTPEGRIHGSLTTNGAVTGRATHSRPNIGQVPSCDKEFGPECRELFESSPGYKLLGCDVSGLELRMLGHFMWKHDGGEYADEVINGDVHTKNQKAIGLESRSIAKRWFYAFLYGSGLFLLGQIAGGGFKLGKRLKANAMRGLPALKEVIEGVQKAVKKKGHLKGLDGRLLHSRSEHSALNLLLQSAGAIVCKQWIVEFDRLLREHGLHNAVRLVAWVHDELQMEVPEEYVEADADGNLTSKVGELCVEAIVIAGNKLGIRVPLTGEYKISDNWKGTH